MFLKVNFLRTPLAPPTPTLGPIRLLRGDGGFAEALAVRALRLTASRGNTGLGAEPGTARRRESESEALLCSHTALWDLGGLGV